ncbi:hypothetical protein ACIBBD_29300 [Streptomyces sp. NPDC051315]|uniref:hypothetical protein n=1 Tax=Streptomyces sp. NPDC051315 TaxID=3365650 RepID=UPI0037AEA9BD
MGFGTVGAQIPREVPLYVRRAPAVARVGDDAVPACEAVGGGELAETAGGAVTRMRLLSFFGIGPTFSWA